MFNLGTIKTNTKSSYYHVNISGSETQDVCLDEDDYWYIVKLFKEYLSDNNTVEILAFLFKSSCLDLLIHELKSSGVSKLLHNIIFDYNNYFYEKYGVEDILSESGYKISKVSQRDLLKTSRKIHRSHDGWIDYQFSSLRAYLYDDAPEWLDKRCISSACGSAVDYFDFLKNV